ncbi:hypothetical protein CTI14_27005 [Methylobacterium radiotolerans]|nr:hypothetical protein CTI14_27005 [Methylobacterium radiotolerans]
MIGSLLRLPREHVVARMLTTVNAQGFDVSLTELGVFMYPGPHGRRPIELARQCNVSRQAMNYVLAELERRGYLLRRPGAASNSTELQLTARGQEMYALMRTCVATSNRNGRNTWANSASTRCERPCRICRRGWAKWIDAFGRCAMQDREFLI